MCSSRKYLCPPQGRLAEIPRGRGVLKALVFEGKYDTKVEFPEGLGVQTKKLSVGGLWIFSGTTHSNGWQAAHKINLRCSNFPDSFRS